MNAKVLIVDDDLSLRKLLVYQINSAGFITAEAGDLKSAMRILEKQEFDVVLTDVHLPDGNGVELIQMIKASYPFIEVIAITSQGRISDGVKAIQNGAFDYLEKGEDTQRLISLLTDATEKALLQRRIAGLDKEVNEYAHIRNRNDVIGQNMEQIERAALIIKAIHSPLRQGIMQFIFTRGKASVTEIYTGLDLEQSIASQHLLILKNAGLVTPHREGKKVYYSANYTGIEKIIALVQQLLKQ